MNIDNFYTLLDLSRQMAETRTLDPLLLRAVDFALELLKAEYGYLVLVDSDGTLNFRIKRLVNGLTLTDEEIQISQSILHHVVTTNRDVISADALVDPELANLESVQAFKVRSVLCVPLIAHGRTIGALYIENRSETDVFDQEDLQLLRFFASQAAISIDNAILNTALEARVEERTRVIERINQQLIQEMENRTRLQDQLVEMAVEQERMVMLSSFIQDAAHQFRTPLSIIKLNVHLMSRTDDLARLKSRLAVIEQQEECLLQLVESLSLMVKLDSGVPLPMYSLDLDEILTAEVTKLERSAHEKQQTLSYELHSSQAAINGNVELIVTALRHIIENAIDFTPEGGSIQIDLYTEAPYWVLDIRDTGIGIAAEHLPKIFDRFYRVDQSGIRLGFGLGLTIAKKIIELHLGMIEVLSEEGTGTLFRLRFPAEH